MPVSGLAWCNTPQDVRFCIYHALLLPLKPKDIRCISINSLHQAHASSRSLTYRHKFPLELNRVVYLNIFKKVAVARI